MTLLALYRAMFLGIASRQMMNAWKTRTGRKLFLSTKEKWELLCLISINLCLLVLLGLLGYAIDKMHLNTSKSGVGAAFLVLALLVWSFVVFIPTMWEMFRKCPKARKAFLADCKAYWALMKQYGRTVPEICLGFNAVYHLSLVTDVTGPFARTVKLSDGVRNSMLHSQLKGYFIGENVILSRFLEVPKWQDLLGEKVEATGISLSTDTSPTGTNKN